MAIDPFLERHEFQDFVNGKGARLCDLAFNRDAPGICPEIFRPVGGLVFVSTEFVEVVTR
jgi:hypothetical protein